MSELFNILDPYLAIIVKSLVILLNLILIFKNVRFIPILLFNIIVSGVLNLFGLQDYDIITSFFSGLKNIISNNMSDVFGCDNFIGEDSTFGTIVGVTVFGPLYLAVKWLKNRFTGGE